MARIKATKVTKQQYANLVDAAKNMWPSVPAANVAAELVRWRLPSQRLDSPIDCGSVCCFGGFCTWWPRFMKQGVFAREDGVPVKVLPNGERLTGFDVAKDLFGDSLLFTPRGSHWADLVQTGFYKGQPIQCTDHALVARRLELVLKHCEVIA